MTDVLYSLEHLICDHFLLCESTSKRNANKVLETFKKKFLMGLKRLEINGTPYSALLHFFYSEVCSYCLKENCVFIDS